MAADGLVDIPEAVGEEDEEEAEGEADASIWRVFLATLDFGELFDSRLRSFR